MSEEMRLRHREVLFAYGIASMAMIGSFILLWYCFWRGPTVTLVPPPATLTAGPDAQIIVEDEHSTAWMAINNGWINGAPQRMNGVLFQFGDLHSRDSTGAVDSIAPFSSVIIEGTNNTVVLTPISFDWIDVRPLGANLTSADAQIAKKLYYPNDLTTPCSIIDGCSNPDMASPTSTCTTPVEDVPASCLRKRSLHAFLKPLDGEWMGAMTYWEGPDAYRMVASKNNDAHHHARYVFELMDNVEVTVFKGLTDQTTALLDGIGRIKKIIISPPGDTDHGDVHDPPMGLGGP